MFHAILDNTRCNAMDCLIPVDMLKGLLLVAAMSALDVLSSNVIFISFIIVSTIP
jgi:hypothetical protein